MAKHWTKGLGMFVLLLAIMALLGSVFIRQEGEELMRQYQEERLQNDYLMGAMQTLERQLWEKDQALDQANARIDSLEQRCR